ncbi:chromate transporter-domain-containing protein [Chaetomium tenue]|uniref:Chromate transporter-domain-containing protein n=1 Tax=Chaetomium tenue TaxID=1854479 RepID=A0ACB7PP07_9PEZI|nr:chromate transporter-domain-containing protein [Chaetomium globosum]
MGVKTRWSPANWAWDNLWERDLSRKLWNTVRETWYLGFTSFGGPPVHFKIFHDKFVTKLHWIDEEVYQELFSVCQAFSGPGSTKMLYCINLIHDGFLSAVLGFLIWSLPAALGMFGLAIGISNVNETLPGPVYALLSGLNAATVGIIALAAVQLAQKAITDKLTRLLVFLGAAAGLLYNALWYFPLLMLIAGIIAVIHDFRWLHGPVKWVAALPRKAMGRKTEREPEPESPTSQGDEVELSQQQPAPSSRPASTKSTTRQRLQTTSTSTTNQDTSPTHPDEENDDDDETRTIPPSHTLQQPTPTTTTSTWKTGLLIILLFLASFTAVMITRGVLHNNPLPYRLFSNLYLAGTIIFGGGPVVIPLLREYVVAEGWVSPRDFLIGLALIQGFPGPNFNFAVYLGALAAAGKGYSPVLGAVLGYVGIYVPGLVTVHGTVGVWGAIRGWRWVRSALRGVNAAAVGLIYTAVYRLWQIGWIDQGFERGTSLADDPWWVVVTASSYVGGCWFGVSPPVACVLGAALGLVRYGVVSG